MAIGKSLDELELLFWTVLRSLETLAVEQYQRFATRLLTPCKQGVVERLQALCPTNAPLEASRLAGIVPKILGHARRSNESETLIVQGLLLEGLGKSIYQAAQTHDAMSEVSRALGAQGSEACAEVTTLAKEELAQRYPDGEQLFATFVTATKGLLTSLDELGQAVDEVFGKRFGIQFADVMGEFTADILPVCLELGMNRRKVVCHMTGALMGM